MHKSKINELETILGYHFSDPQLLVQALTHPSMEGHDHYQRLEFLGDRVLGLVMAHWLYDTYPNDAEGKLSRRFIGLVRKETLAEVSQSIGLDKYVIYKQARDECEATQVSLAADVMEATIAAIYKDGGFDQAMDFVKKYFTPLLENIPAHRDPKSALQELAQAQGLDLPKYILEGRDGPDHQPIFHIKVVVDTLGEASASGASKREAESKAATILLAQLSEGQK